MHIVVFNWFGAFSIIWFVPLIWHFAKAARHGGNRLRGPGTIRRWLGLVCTLAASCAIEAALIEEKGNLLGNILLNRASQWLGPVGALCGLWILLIVSVPRLMGFRWRDTLRWLKVNFGFHLASQAPAAKIGHTQRQRQSAMGAHVSAIYSKRTARTHISHISPPKTFKTQKNPRRYTRPTAWYPPVTPHRAANPPGKIRALNYAPHLPPKLAMRETLDTFARHVAAPAHTETPKTHLPLHARPRPPAPTPSTPASVQRPDLSNMPRAPAALHPRTAPQPHASMDMHEILAAIETNTAQWATLAGLARTSNNAWEHDADLRIDPPEFALLEVKTATRITDKNDNDHPSSTCPEHVTPHPAPSRAPEIAALTPLPDDACVDQYDEAKPSVSTESAAPCASPVVAHECDAEQAPCLADSPSEAFSHIEPLSLQREDAPAEFAFHAPLASTIELPSLDLLERTTLHAQPIDDDHLTHTAQLIEQRLQEFKVPVTVVGACAGPVITRFEVEPALGVRGNQIVGLMKDLARGLGLTSIRIVETIPGKTCMGLELPNALRQIIRLADIFDTTAYRHSGSQLTLALGQDITGQPIMTDLAKAPHMLVAGTTGAGKSVAINAMILSLLFQATPEAVRLIMIDPKMLELSIYEGIPHLLAPVVTDMKLAANALTWCVGEMEKRYRLMSALGVRNLASFNQKICDAQAAGTHLPHPFSLTPDAPEPLSTLPFIVVVIDELADLMMVAGKKIEELIARLAQKARAAGIHLILATQRPSVDVITGLIKANIPTRVAFQVSSKIDSRTILDQMGAETLLGAGDMLFLPPGAGYAQRVHGAFVADEEVHRVVHYLKQFGEPHYEEGILDASSSDAAMLDGLGDSSEAQADPLYDEAVAFVVRTRRASISAVQRQLRIGYNRAARLVEHMETVGLVSSMSVNGSREVLAPALAQ